MIEKLNSEKILAGPQESVVASSNLAITIFTIPKTFDGHFGIIQRNAIRSWKAIGLNVILMGDDPGVADAAAELQVQHAGPVAVNQQGTPLLSDAFRMAHSKSNSPILVYCNSDVILLSDFKEAISELRESDLADDFLMIGRRTNLLIRQEIEFDSVGTNQALHSRLLSKLQDQGRKDSVVCKEYFVFPRHRFNDIPKFAVGRGNWDNWMVAHAKSQRIPVVDASRFVNAIHQQHDYSHTDENRLACYVSGNEARENQRLADGRNLIDGSTADWKLDSDGNLRRCRMRWMRLGFWRDLPRLVRLLFNLFSSR